MRLGNTVSSDNNDATDMANNESRRAAMVVLGGTTAAPTVGRRGSFLYRSPDSMSEMSPMSISRKLSSSEA